MKTITQDNMNAINNAKLNASKEVLSDMLSNIVVLTGKETHSELKEIIRAIRRGELDDITLVTDETINEHKIDFIETISNHLTNLPESYMNIVREKESAYYKFLEVALSGTMIYAMLESVYNTVCRHGRIEKNYLIGQIRTGLPRPRVSINARNYEHSLLRFSAEVITAMKLTNTLLFDSGNKNKSEILLPRRSGFPVVLDDSEETEYNLLRGISRKSKYQTFTKVKGSTERRKLKRNAKKYLAKHSNMNYRVRRWLSEEDIKHLVSLEMNKTLQDFDNNKSENKGDKKAIIARFTAMTEQLLDLKEYESFKMKRMLDSRGRIYSMWSLLYTKLGKSLIEPINSYTMDSESMKEVQYHSYCTVYGKVPYEEAIANYTTKISETIESRCSSSLQSITDQGDAYDWIINKELLTMLNTPIGGLCFTNIGADYTNMGLMTHAAMSGDAKALNMANLGDNTKQYDSHNSILDRFLSMAKDDTTTVGLMIRLLNPDKYLTSDIDVTDEEISKFRVEFPDMTYATNKLRNSLRKGVKKLISQGLFHGQTSKVVAKKFGLTELQVVQFKTEVFGESIRDVENIALWMKYNVDAKTSSHNWKAPDGIICFSQYYMKAAYSVLYSSNPTTTKGYSTTQYICDLPLLKVGKRWFVNELPKSSRITTKVNTAKLMGGYANITHSWDAYNMRSIIRVAIRLGINVLDIHDYVYSTPKMVKLARTMAKRNYIKYTTEHGNYFQNVVNHIAKIQGIKPLEFTDVKKHQVNMNNNNCFTVKFFLANKYSYKVISRKFLESKILEKENKNNGLHYSNQQIRKEEQINTINQLKKEIKNMKEIMAGLMLENSSLKKSLVLLERKREGLRR